MVPIRPSRLASAGLVFLLACSACVRPAEEPTTGPSPSGAGGDSDNGDGPKPYAEVVTEEAVTDSGMVHVHRVDDKILFEIPNDVLGREILLVTRTVRVPTGMGYGGGKLNTQVLRWEKNGGDEERIFLRVVTHVNVADDSLPVFEAVRNANFETILHAFDIEAFNEDTTTVVIDVSSLFESDIPMLGLRQSFRDQYRVRSLDSNRSYVVSVKSFDSAKTSFSVG